MSEWKDGPPPESEGAYACQCRSCQDHLFAYNFWDGSWRTATGQPFALNRAHIARHCRIPDLPKPLPLPRRFRAKRVGIPVSGVQFSKTPCLFLWESATGWGWGNTEGEFKEIEWIDHEPTQESQP